MYTEQKTKNEKMAKKHQDYVKTFYDKFGEALHEKSPEHWKLLLYDILNKILECKEKSNESLEH